MKEYFKNIYETVSTVLVGMGVTWKHLFQKKVTIQYPDERLELPPRERNRLFVDMEDCIGCRQCENACPVDCIEIETVKAVPGDDAGKTKGGQKKVFHVTKFTIDFSKCCFCSFCVFPCPTECIKMTDVYEYSEYERNNLIYNFSAFTEEEAKEKKEKYAQFEKEKAAQKVAAAQSKPVVESTPNKDNKETLT